MIESDWADAFDWIREVDISQKAIFRLKSEGQEEGSHEKIGDKDIPDRGHS